MPHDSANPPFARRIEPAETTPPADDRAQAARRLATLARILDAQFTIPGTGFSFGIDPLLGLIPGAGDLISAGLALLIVKDARTLGASKPLQMRMLTNIGIDVVVGAIPLLGDVFDFAFRASAKNLKLAREAGLLDQPGGGSPDRPR